jgi:hypothetical protein
MGSVRAAKPFGALHCLPKSTTIQQVNSHMHSLTKILVVIAAIGLCMPSCSMFRSKHSPVRPLDLSAADLNFEAELTLDGSVIRFSTSNREKLIWLVVEDKLNVGWDGFFMGETFSFVSGNYIGTSMHSTGRAFILPPGETKIARVDLNKNYANLNLSETKPPKSSPLGIAAFDSSESAHKFFEYLSIRRLEIRTQAHLHPYTHYECIWKHITP